MTSARHQVVDACTDRRLVSKVHSLAKCAVNCSEMHGALHGKIPGGLHGEMHGELHEELHGELIAELHGEWRGELHGE